jgi:hypothetical protein
MIPSQCSQKLWQLLGNDKFLSEARNTARNNRRNVWKDVLYWVCPEVMWLHHPGSSEVDLGVVGGDTKKTQYLGVNWAPSSWGI